MEKLPEKLDKFREYFYYELVLSGYTARFVQKGRVEDLYESGILDDYLTPRTSMEHPNVYLLRTLSNRTVGVLVPPDEVGGQYSETIDAARDYLSSADGGYRKYTFENNEQ